MARPGSNNGNVTSEQIASSSGLNADQSFMADAYNRLQTAQETVCGAQRGHDELYLYDEEVRQVEKTTDAAATVYVYDAAGNEVAQYSTQAQVVGGTGGAKDETGSPSCRDCPGPCVLVVSLPRQILSRPGRRREVPGRAPTGF